MLKFPVHTRNSRTSCITVAVAPPTKVGVGRNESVPISRNSPSINIGGPNGPKRLSSAAYLSRPYLNPNTCTASAVRSRGQLHSVHQYAAALLGGERVRADANGALEHAILKSHR